jgi:hypothetical protein
MGAALGKGGGPDVDVVWVRREGWLEAGSS